MIQPPTTVISQQLRRGISTCVALLKNTLNENIKVVVKIAVKSRGKSRCKSRGKNSLNLAP